MTADGPGEGAITLPDPEPSADDGVPGYKQSVDRAHAHGIHLIGVTLMPFVDTFKGAPLSAC